MVNLFSSEAFDVVLHTHTHTHARTHALTHHGIPSPEKPLKLFSFSLSLFSLPLLGKDLILSCDLHD